MATNAKIECSLNTTECILETIASILGEVQEQNAEYNWDPLTFLFTAIIGVIAIVFAALTAFQSFLAAGPGRTKSGAYAIGPWSRQNHRKFDFTEMRFRTTASTPILTIDSLDLSLLENRRFAWLSPERVSKGANDYFPATWLALLSHLALDNTRFWGEVKMTGADFIPSELSAVPAYGSIRFVATLAMILSQGFGHLTIDRETGLPRIRDRRFNLTFRHHPLLGVIGFFEMYGKIKFQESNRGRELYERLLQAHGQMDFSARRLDDERIKTTIKANQALTFNPHEGGVFMKSFQARLRQECPHRDQQPKPACLNLVLYSDTLLICCYVKGPLCLLLARNPEALPSVFPHKRTKLCERLSTLLLQSRFWSMISSASYDLHLSPSMNEVYDGLQFTKTVVSWARSEVDPDIDELNLSDSTYRCCLDGIVKTLNQEGRYDDQTITTQSLIERDLECIDSWLKKIEPYILCRKLTLSVIGEGIQQMIDTVQQQSSSEPEPDVTYTAVHSSLDVYMLPTLYGKLSHFLKAVDDHFNWSRLYSEKWIQETFPRVSRFQGDLNTVKYDTFEGLRRIQELWAIRDLHVNVEDSGSEDGADQGQVHEIHEYAWKFPTATVHPLDDLLIYRPVLLTLIYCLSSDSSELMDEDAYGTIVPIM